MARSRAEYFRNYRRTITPRKQRSAHQEGVQEGVEMACKFLREIIGEKSYTGFHAAFLVWKTLGIAKPGNR